MPRYGIKDSGLGPPQVNGHPGDWYFEVPETGYKIQKSSMHALGHEIIRHWEANKIPFKDVFYEIAQQICGKVGKPYCYDMDNPSEVPNRPKTHGPGWAELWNGTVNLTKWATKGRNFVSQEVANERAAQCSSCPNNLPTETCLSCKFKQAALEVAKGTVNGLTTPFDAKLQVCDVCKCSTKVLAHVYDPEYMNESITNEQIERFKQVNCWKLKR